MRPLRSRRIPINAIRGGAVISGCPQTVQASTRTHTQTQTHTDHPAAAQGESTLEGGGDTGARRRGLEAALPRGRGTQCAGSMTRAHTWGGETCQTDVQRGLQGIQGAAWAGHFPGAPGEDRVWGPVSTTSLELEGDTTLLGGGYGTGLSLLLCKLGCIDVVSQGSHRLVCWPRTSTPDPRCSWSWENAFSSLTVLLSGEQPGGLEDRGPGWAARGRAEDPGVGTEVKTLLVGAPGPH